MTYNRKPMNEYNLGPAERIPSGEGREFTVAGRIIAVFRPRSGGIYATQALCPHRQGPLTDGILGGTTIICPFHAWKFDISSGKGLPTNPGEGCLTTHPVTVQDDGTIVLTLNPETADAAGKMGGECIASS